MEMDTNPMPSCDFMFIFTHFIVTIEGNQANEVKLKTKYEKLD